MNRYTRKTKNKSRDENKKLVKKKKAVQGRFYQELHAEPISQRMPEKIALDAQNIQNFETSGQNFPIPY